MSVSLLTLGYAVWSSGAYVNLAADVLQWVLLIVGGLVLVFVSTVRHITTRFLLIVGGSAFGGGAVLGFTINHAAIVISYIPFAFVFGGLLLIASALHYSEFSGSLKRWLIVGEAEAMLLVWSLWLGPGQLFYILSFGVIGAALIAFRIFRWGLVAPTVVAACCLFAASLYYITTGFGTDALILTTYAAHLILSGVNPYIPGATAGAFNYYHIFSAQYFTPLLNGGRVSWNPYTSFAAYIEIPALVLGVAPKLIYGMFAVMTVMTMYIRYRGEKTAVAASLLVFAAAGFLVFPFDGITDIVYVFFLMLSFIFVKKHMAVSAVCLGLALASKQTAFLILPFYLYFIYREHGRNTARYVIISAMVFVTTNLPFILTNLNQWIFSFVSPELPLMIPTGQGFNILTFLGVYVLPRTYYVLNEIMVAAMLLVLYVLEYDRLKYSFVAFPIFIFLFNERLLFNYLVYWPVLMLAMLPEIHTHIGKPGINTKRAAAIVCVMILFPVGTAVVMHQPQQHIMTGVTGTTDNGVVTNLVVYTTEPCGVSLHFRVFASQLFTVNGILLNGTCSENASGSGGVYHLVPITQTSTNFTLPFIIDAYNLNISESAMINILNDTRFGIQGAA
jgi:uncharacterized membrane protein